jgi:hypothetical protein
MTFKCEPALEIARGSFLKALGRTPIGFHLGHGLLLRAIFGLLMLRYSSGRGSFFRRFPVCSVTLLQNVTAIDAITVKLFDQAFLPLIIIVI